MTDFEQENREATTTVETTRRRLLRASAAGFALAASGVFLPQHLPDAVARKGAANGQLGGRRGTDHRGRDRRRTHGDKKEDRGNTSDKPPGAGLQIAKDVQMTFHNDGPNPLSVVFWYDGNPLLNNQWHQDRGPINLTAEAAEKYQSPTRSGGAWIDTGGFLQTFWVAAFNPLLGSPEVSFRWGGEVQDGVGHRGGSVVEQASVSLNEGDEFTWRVQQRVATVRRERDSDDSKVFTVRLRPTWA